MSFAAFAQEKDTAYVPFFVNVDAKVRAEQGNVVFEMNVEANKVDTLKIIVDKGGFTSVSRQARRQQNSLVRMSGSHGRVTLNLPSHLYRDADISLYSLNGKQVLRDKADASQTRNNITQANLTAGVYLLSVKGVNGQSFSNRVTHRGGNFNINVVFGNEQNLTGRTITAANASVIWTITISAEGYADSSYTLNPVVGVNTLQTTTLNSNSGTFIDNRDDKEYRWVRIGTQIWMAENLNYDTANGTGSWCYADSLDNCAKYGRLYNWRTAMAGSASSSSNPSGVRGVCPQGWHVPSRAEWVALVTAAGGQTVAYTKLKSQTGWQVHSDIPIGTDEFGFSALPGGNRRDGGNFTDVSDAGYWWSTTMNGSSDVWFRRILYNNENVFENGNRGRDVGFSVRCLKTASH